MIRLRSVPPATSRIDLISATITPRGESSVSTTDPNGHTEGEQFKLQLTTGLLGQPQVIAATVDLSKEELPTTIETTLTNADLSQLFAALIPNSDVRVTGHATGTLRATGNIYGDEGFSLGALRGTANFSQLVVQVQDVLARRHLAGHCTTGIVLGMTD